MVAASSWRTTLRPDERQSLRELHLVIEFGKANHVTAATTAIAVEQALAGIHEEAWFVIGVQRTQSHQSATAEMSDRLPIMSLQIVQQRNLVFQLVESLAIHGLLASIGRIRQSAPRSQARMVGVHKKCSPWVRVGTQGEHFLRTPTILAWDLGALCRILPIEARSP